MRYPTSPYAVALATALLATPVTAQVVDYGKYPNFNGVWIALAPQTTGVPLGARLR